MGKVENQIIKRKKTREEKFVAERTEQRAGVVLCKTGQRRDQSNDL